MKEGGRDWRWQIKKLAFALLTALLVLGAIEAMAWLTHIVLYEEDAGSTSSPAFINEVAGGAIHPFYGTIVEWELHDLNVVSHQKECALVVGLLGGSVAGGVSREFRRALFRHVAGLGRGVSPVWIDLAHGDYRQPQQAQALVNKLANGARFDIVVSLDGYNEITQARGVHDLSLFPFYPGMWPSSIAMTVEQRIAGARILALRGEQEFLRKGGGWIAASATFGLLRRRRLDEIQRLVLRHHHDLFEAGTASYSLEKHGPRGTYAPDELRRTAAESWYRGAWLLARLARRHDAEYYHFLQPNQYVPGTKPLTDEELAKAFRLSRGAEEVRLGYPLLVAQGRRLREQGVEFFDLSYIYADSAETLYKDDCCHLNERGHELLAAAMMQRIVDATDGDGAIDADSENESCLRPYRSAVGRIEAGEYGEPAARSVFDIYRKERTLVYLKRDCTVDDIMDTFYLHFTRRDGGVRGRGFRFTQHGVILDGETCVAIIRLDDDGIVHMRTGQSEGSRDAWSAEPDVAGLDAPRVAT